jgi:subtilisin family serine protease
MMGEQMVRKVAALLVTLSVLTACGGGGGGSNPAPASSSSVTNPTPSPSPSAASATASIVVGTTSQTISFGSAALGVQGGITIPPASSGSGATVTATLSPTAPASVPALQSIVRFPHAQSAGRSTKSANASAVLGYITFTVSTTLTLTASPAFTFVLPSALPATNYYAGFYNGSAWQDAYLSGVASGTSVTYFSNADPLTFTPGTTYAFAFYASATSVATPTPAPAASTPASTATTSPGTSAAFLCPTSDSTTEPAAIVRRVTGGADAVRRAPRKPAATTATTGTMAKIAVLYDNRRFTAPAQARGVTSREASAGAAYVAQMSLEKDNRTLRVLSVPTASLAKAEAALRAQAGVIIVGSAGGKRRALTVSTPYFTKDPYFDGFTAAQNTVAYGGASPTPSIPPATYETLPYVESAGVPGQWDMHAIGLEHAYGYSQIGNGSSVLNVNALGSSSVHIAVIDTGEDPNHPELAGKIVRQRCFITSDANVANPSQSTGNYTLDQDGHGTDVSGIAAAGSNNGFGFTGAGGNATIYAYRVFPTPDDNCSNPGNTTDDACETDTTDIASAITDAVNAGANVISMSLGSSGGTGNSGCTGNGVDSDTTEGTAVAYAIAHNVIVVAAAGNSGTAGAGIDAPGCDSGVITVGATSLDDGATNGTSLFGGTAGKPVEYVASYSQYATPGTQYRSASAWGIVAPGGDPDGNTDNDDLHWIENIWTTTPYESSASDDAFLGECSQDYPNGSVFTGAVDCRTLIAGTSMATPHVAGAVALILSATGTSGRYASPTAMKTLLCSTTDQLTTTGSTQNQGCGRLNIYRAMATALGDPSPP